jgi:hypothetical protein
MPPQIAAWLAQPFSPQMSAARWFLFVGLLIVLLWSWREVFHELTVIEGDLT